MKIIGIVGRIYFNLDNQDTIQLNAKLFNVLKNYSDITSIVLLDNKDNNHILGLCDGFIVPGGTSWSNFDEYVIEYAVNSGKPLLAICAGFQAVCSMYSLNRDKLDMTKHFNDDKHYKTNGDYAHKNRIVSGTLLSKILKTNEILVNSLHHSYIDTKLCNLKISAYSSDNIIEAVELDSHPFFIGIQWHPEYLVDDNSRKIFDYFIRKVKET